MYILISKFLNGHWLNGYTKKLIYKTHRNKPKPNQNKTSRVRHRSSPTTLIHAAKWEPNNESQNTLKLGVETLRHTMSDG